MEKTMKKTSKLVTKLIAKKTKQNTDLEKLLKADNILHLSVTCDGCGVKPIRGLRFKCAVCNNFDYCADCEYKNKDFHQHPFIMIRKPEIAPISCTCIIPESVPILQNNIINNRDYSLLDVIEENLQVNSNRFNSLSQSFVADVKELNSECLNCNNFQLICTEGTKEIVTSIKLRNNGSKPWPKPVFLACINQESTAFGKTVPIKIKVDMNKENNIEVKICSKDLTAGNYESVWQLQNEKNECFGCKVKFNVTIEKIQKFIFVEQPIVSNNVRSSNEVFESYVYQCQVDELKKEFDLKRFDDKTIKNAAKIAKGDIDGTLEVLLSQRSYDECEEK